MKTQKLKNTENTERVHMWNVLEQDSDTEMSMFRLVNYYSCPY